jgi:penicillin-binding protein 1C
VAPRGAPRALKTLAPTNPGPALIFPPDGSTVQMDSDRGFVLAARGEGLRWYVEGRALEAEPVSGRVVWTPPSPGFYSLKVVDGQGREARAKVRVRG